MTDINFAPASYASDTVGTSWEPFLVPKEAIDTEIDRLLTGPMPASGFRSSSVVHPSVSDGVPSLTPVTEVAINVLAPGERTPERRGNYSLLEISILGGGRVQTGDPMDVSLHDVCTIPSMHPFSHHNTGDKPWAWLSYSNAPLLRRTGTYFSEAGPFARKDATAEVSITQQQAEQYNRVNGPIHEMPSTGAELRGYEYLTDIEPVPNPPQHWAWEDMSPYIPQFEGDNKDPSKRGIWLMYNPATERRQGTTPTHFATFAGAAPGTRPYKGTRGHLHTSASINYHTRGHGYSTVAGKRIDWKAGDLLFSAPSWVEHAHYFGDDGWTVLTVQDHPLHISMASLLWQENVNDPILSLGNEEGQKGYVFPRETGE